MKFSDRIERCSLSPIRKFHPYVLAAQAAGKKVYHLNIGLMPSGAFGKTSWPTPPLPGWRYIWTLCGTITGAWASL